VAAQQNVAGSFWFEILMTITMINKKKKKNGGHYVTPFTFLKLPFTTTHSVRVVHQSIRRSQNTPHRCSRRLVLHSSPSHAVQHSRKVELSQSFDVSVISGTNSSCLRCGIRRTKTEKTHRIDTQAIQNKKNTKNLLVVNQSIKVTMRYSIPIFTEQKEY
jgi:hypothetical protein